MKAQGGNESVQQECFRMWGQKRYTEFYFANQNEDFFYLIFH